MGFQSGICDVLVAGSGAGGLAAALTARLHGLDVIMIEKESLFGGTTAYSAGVIWVPVNSHQKAAGVTDTREDALTYLTHHVGNRLDRAKAEAFLDNAPVMLDLFEREGIAALAQTAAELANDDAHALARSAHALTYFGHEYDRATSMVDKAVALNPNLSVAWHARGWIAMMCCEPDRAIESFARSSRFNPNDRSRIAYWMGSSHALWQLGRYDEGYALATKAIQFSSTVLSLNAYIANAVSAGRLDQARQAVKRLLIVAPHYCVSDVYEKAALRDANLREKFVGCLRDAGLPEN